MYSSIGWGAVAPLSGYIVQHFGVRVSIAVYFGLAVANSVFTGGVGQWSWVGAQGAEARRVHPYEQRRCKACRCSSVGTAACAF